MMSLTQVNAMSPEAFVAAFGDVAEHSPWVAQAAARQRPFASREAMIGNFEKTLRAAPHEAQLTLVRAHPDLATKAKLTDDSTREQAQAGLGSLSAEEFARFDKLNTAYKARFGFPFIFAVKGATKHQILSGFAERVGNDLAVEFGNTITQINRIFRFRIEDRVAP